MRITSKQLEAQASIVRDMTGVNVVIYGAYGGYGVHVRHADTSHTDLMGGCQAAREASRFLSGMIAAARMTTS